MNILQKESIYHICLPNEFDQYKKDGIIRPKSLDREGFIHCSTSEQLNSTIERFYSAEQEILILELDEKQLGDNLKYEDTYGHGLFPHVYSPINFDVIISIEKKFMMSDTVFTHIKNCAKVPSFSTFEERLHPYVESVVNLIPTAKLDKVPTNNLVIQLAGDKSQKTVVLTAHLDKIDHFNDKTLTELPYSESEDKIKGQLDNTVGLGVCLSILEWASQQKDIPNLILLFSEMEEGMGLREHPERMKNGGKGYMHGQGAEALSRFLIEEAIEPEAIITIDTTPKFKGEKGIALYANWWEHFKQKPTDAELSVTKELVDTICEINKDILVTNNTNDFMIYGRVVNRNSFEAIPSIALEPAIFPYHQKDEEVFKSDVIEIMNIVKHYLKQI